MLEDKKFNLTKVKLLSTQLRRYVATICLRRYEYARYFSVDVADFSSRRNCTLQCVRAQVDRIMRFVKGLRRFS